MLCFNLWDVCECRENISKWIFFLLLLLFSGEFFSPSVIFIYFNSIFVFNRREIKKKIASGSKKKTVSIIKTWLLWRNVTLSKSHWQ